MPYEHKSLPMLTPGQFLLRLLLHILAAVAMVLVSLGIGMWGYAHFERLAWLDAFLNAAMLLGGMGPIEFPQTEGGKLFAGCFALYSGLVFLIAAGLIWAPIVHRILHRFHLDEREE